jgi:hypothetical protein
MPGTPLPGEFASIPLDAERKMITYNSRPPRGARGVGRGQADAAPPLGRAKGLASRPGGQEVSQVERIDPRTLQDWLADPEVFILDVRSPRAWEDSQAQIPGSHRFNPHQPVETWAQNIPKDKKLVAY